MSTAGLPLRVLVIDDDPVMRELLEVVLAFEGHTVLAASTGEAALPVLADPEQPIDVVLSDLHLPGLHGSELAARLDAARPPATLLLGMSGSKPTRDEKKLFDSFLQKPFTTGEFAEAVADAFARRLNPGQRKPRTRKTAAPPPAETPESPLSIGAAAAEPAATPVLDENIFTRLGATLPPAQLRELYELTLRDVRERLQRMEAAELAGDRETVRREAHAIKGSCGMVGATEIHRLAAATEGGSAGSTPPLADFTAACMRLQRMLDARLH